MSGAWEGQLKTRSRTFPPLFALEYQDKRVKNREEAGELELVRGEIEVSGEREAVRRKENKGNDQCWLLGDQKG